MALATTTVYAKKDMAVGVQYSHTVFGLSLKKDVTEKVIVQGTLGITNSDDIGVYGLRGIYKLTEDKDWYTYGFGSLSYWKYKTLEISGTFNSAFKDSSSIGFGLGAGLEYALSSFSQSKLPLYWSIELGYDKVSIDSLKGGAHGVNLDTSIDIGGVFIGTGFHYKF